MSATDGLIRSIIGRLRACNVDELRVLDQLLVRLELGRDRYGASRPCGSIADSS